MKIWIVVISIGLLVFLAGCAKQETVKIQFKNDVITIENYVVSDLGPYAGQKVTISFDIKNNGDRPIRWVEVKFFDTPGFELIKDCEDGYAQKTQGGTKLDVCTCVDDTNQKCQKGSEVAKGSLECNKFGDITSSPEDERSCTFGTPQEGPTTSDVIDSLDTRSVKFTLKTPTTITSPTPFTVSFSVAYRYGSVQQSNTYFFSGERTALIPVIDPNFKKEPSSKFSQSDPTTGPIVFDIVPSLEREKMVDKKTVKEYWGVVDRSFQTKFTVKKIVSEGVLRDIPPYEGSDCRTSTKGASCVELRLTNLKIDETTGVCDFKPFNNNVEGEAKKVVNEKNNTLVCSFKPTSQTGFTSEFTGTITVQYNYDYEIIKKQNFVVQPAIS